MGRRVALVAACGALFAVLCVAVATSDDVPLAARGPSLSWELPEPEGLGVLVEAAEEAEEAPPEDPPPEPIDLPDFVEVLLQILLVACGVVVLAWAWRHRPRLQWRRPDPVDEFDVLDAVASSLAADASTQRSLLAHGAPRNAIVACWLRLEAVIADAGVERRPADTPQEFAHRVLSRFAVDAASVDRLSALYREARFSTHDMGEQQRTEAIRALDAIHRDLADLDRPADAASDTLTGSTS